MQAIISPIKIKGTITAPASKSAMQRACAAALIKKGTTVLHNPGISADDQAALNIIRQLGASYSEEENNVIIKSNGIQPISDNIHCDESGLSIRMFTSIAALSSQAITITGGGSLLKRPLSFFDEVFPSLNVNCFSNKGYLPLQVKGPLQPKDITVDGSLSSQFLTGLLFAYSAANASGITIKVDNLNSKPYVDLTLQILKDFGLKVPENKNYQEFYFNNSINQSKSTDQPLSYTVEGDWSNAAFLLVAGAIAGDIAVQGMSLDSVQGDKKILDVLNMSNAQVNIQHNAIHVAESNLKAFEFDATDCPDLFPPLVALAAYCNGVSKIKGVHRLTHKKSNRAATLQQEFNKMNVTICFENDVMVVEGGNVIESAEVSSHNDHRIAMACAIAGLKANGKTTINHSEAVNKSYKNFWLDLNKLQANSAC